MRYNLSDVSSIVNHYLSEIRDVEIQKDPLRFRANLERIASILGYEVSKKMSFEDHVVETPLGNSNEK